MKISFFNLRKHLTSKGEERKTAPAHAQDTFEQKAHNKNLRVVNVDMFVRHLCDSGFTLVVPREQFEGGNNQILWNSEKKILCKVSTNARGAFSACDFLFELESQNPRATEKMLNQNPGGYSMYAKGKYQVWIKLGAFDSFAEICERIEKTGKAKFRRAWDGKHTLSIGLGTSGLGPLETNRIRSLLPADLQEFLRKQ